MTAGLEDLEKHIVVEKALTPQDIQDRYHVLDGAIYGLASHGRFLALSQPTDHLMLKGSTWRVDLLTLGRGCQWY